MKSRAYRSLLQLLKTVPVFGLAVIARWAVLAGSPFPIGVDGYYYAVQVRELIEHGRLAIAAEPLAFWIMAPLAAITDPIVGAKLGAAIGGALVVVPAYGLGTRLGKGDAAGFVAAALAATSAGSMYLAMEFVKQGIGITVALGAIWLGLRAIDRPTRARIGAAVVGAGAALLAHKLAIAIVVVIGSAAVLAAAWARGALHGRRGRGVAIGVVVAIGAAVVMGEVFPQRFASIGELGLLARLFGAHARWSAPAFVAPHETLAMGHEALIAGALGLAAAVVLVRRALAQPPGDRAASWALVGFALLVAVPWLAVDDPQGLGFRLRLAAFVPVALCAAIVTGAGLAWLERRGHRRAGAIAAVVLASVVAVARRPPTDGEVLAQPALVAAVMALDGRIPPDATAIVPGRQLAFMIAWYTRARVALRPDVVPPERRVRVLPLAFIESPLEHTLDGSPLEHAIDAARAEPQLAPPIGVHPLHPDGLVLVAEPTWSWILPPAARARAAAWPTY